MLHAGDLLEPLELLLVEVVRWSGVLNDTLYSHCGWDGTGPLARKLIWDGGI
jgi:hypothetical protein